jgi:hypothetical protein
MVNESLIEEVLNICDQYDKGNAQIIIDSLKVVLLSYEGDE